MFGPCSRSAPLEEYAVLRFRMELPGPRASASRNSRSASSSKPSRAVIFAQVRPEQSDMRRVLDGLRKRLVGLANLRVERARSPIGSCSTRLSDRAQLHRARSLQSPRYDRVRTEPSPIRTDAQVAMGPGALPPGGADGRGPIPGRGEPAEAEVSFIIGRVELERSTKTPLGRVEITQFVLDVAHDDEKRFAFAQRHTFLERCARSASFASSLRTSPSQK